MPKEFTMKKLLIFLIFPALCCGKMIDFSEGVKCAAYSCHDKESYQGLDIVEIYVDALPNFMSVAYFAEKGTFKPAEEGKDRGCLCVNGRIVMSYEYQEKQVKKDRIAYFYFKEDQNPERMYMAVINITHFKNSFITVFDQTL